MVTPLVMDKKTKNQREFEKLVKLKQDDRKVQALELQEQLDLFIKAIKDNDWKSFIAVIVKDNMVPHYLYCNMFYPIHVACEFGRLRMVQYLVEDVKVNLDARCQITGYTPIMYASQTAQTHIVEYLGQTEIGADLNARASLQRRDNHQTTISAKEGTESDDEDGMSALHTKGGRTCVEVLMDSQQHSAAENLQRQIDSIR